MNAGLGNLFSLKTHLLGLAPGTDETRFDPVIQDLGQGVAAQMENFCGRKFARAVGDQFVGMADRTSFLLARYPLEEITLTEIKLDDTDGWVQAGADVPVIESTSPLSGIVYVHDNTDAGPYWAQVRFSYTGGYFFETLEPTDAGYPTAPPAGAYALPDDLKLCWLMQCRRVWSAFEKIGSKITDNSADAQAALQTLDWAPDALRILAHYRRMELV